METDGQLIHHALHMRANLIETGNPLFSAIDAQNQNRSRPAHELLQIKALDINQMKLVIRLRELGDKELNRK